MAELITHCPLATNQIAFKEEDLFCGLSARLWHQYFNNVMQSKPGSEDDSDFFGAKLCHVTSGLSHVYNLLMLYFS